MAFSLLVSPLLLFIPFLFFKLLRWRRCKLPPGPKPWPVVGNLFDIKPVRFRCFAEWAVEYGPIVSVWFGSRLNVVVSSSELAKEVLKEKDQLLAARPRNKAIQYFSRNGQDLIWADYGPHFVKVRKVCTLELFTPKRLESLRPIREDEVTAMVEAIFRDCTKPGMWKLPFVVHNLLLPSIKQLSPSHTIFFSRQSSISLSLSLSLSPLFLPPLNCRLMSWMERVGKSPLFLPPLNCRPSSFPH